MDNRDATRNTYDKKCAECGAQFTSSRTDAKYCSVRCRQSVQRRKRRNEAAKLAPGQYLKIDRPPVRYYGGKWRIAQWIIDQFPAHITYVEPFCGAANVLFRKPPSKHEIINDLNHEVVNFFDVLRVRPDDLIRAIRLTPHSRAEHRRAHAIEGDHLERARRFYVRSWQSFGGGEGEYNTGWRYQANYKRGSSIVDDWNDVDRLWQAAERLKQVQIECDDALKVLQRFDTTETLFYVDPPYMFSTRYSEEKRYAHEMSDDQHIQLADALKDLQGMVIVSGYPSELYQSLYSGWMMIQKDTRTNANHDAVEVLWISPEAQANQLPLFKGLTS